MKFIIRNLGWILLIIFFVFMLYLISSQNNIKNIDNKVNTGSISESNIDKNISPLVDTKIISNEISSKTISSEVEVKNNTGSFINSVRNFFTLEKSDKILENYTWSNLEIDSIDLEKNISEIEKIELKLEKEEEVIEEEVTEVNKNIIEEEIKTSTWGFIQSIKNLFSSDEEEEEVEEEEIQKNIWVVDEKLIKKVDKIVWKNNNIESINNNTKNSIKTVWVKSIFLNNAYFTERLYTAYRWDKLEQLTATNKYGCFKVKVISSEIKSNIGKTAWTCEYYMEWKTDTIKEFKNITKDYYKNIKSKKITSVNKIKEVSVKSVYLNNAYFTKRLFTVHKWDKLEQLTAINKYGCFKVKVISSKNSLNNWKIAWTCQKYLK